MSSLHGIQGSLEKYKGKGNYFNPIEEELNHQQNLVAKGNNIWVFKGHAPDVCRIYGKGHPWCISSSTSAAHWFTYRIRYHQTQYFVFDYNKDEDDPARYVNPGVSPEGIPNGLMLEIDTIPIQKTEIQMLASMVTIA
jgi:hypothetical protein